MPTQVRRPPADQASTARSWQHDVRRRSGCQRHGVVGLEPIGDGAASGARNTRIEPSSATPPRCGHVASMSVPMTRPRRQAAVKPASITYSRNSLPVSGWRSSTIASVVVVEPHHALRLAGDRSGRQVSAGEDGAVEVGDRDRTGTDRRQLCAVRRQGQGVAVADVRDRLPGCVDLEPGPGHRFAARADERPPVRCDHHAVDDGQFALGRRVTGIGAGEAQRRRQVGRRRSRASPLPRIAVATAAGGGRSTASSWVARPRSCCGAAGTRRADRRRHSSGHHQRGRHDDRGQHGDGHRPWRGRDGGAAAGRGRDGRQRGRARARRVRVVEVVDVHGCSSAQLGPRLARRRSRPRAVVLFTVPTVQAIACAVSCSDRSTR